MNERAELVSQMRASLTHRLELKRAESVLHTLQDELLVPNGLYLNGGLSHFGDASDLSPEIVGLVIRADGTDISERDRSKVEAWLGANPHVTEFSMGPLKPADSPEFLPIGSEEDE